ncbi:hypothetical protein [Limosilactobacillus mucosae]|uniref:hypothetical protein n=1 Tax=Limosilactobacillus mucosae TaxID=97478 RepID=UPI0022E54298|nr:hypothetical protein [Limosilactobacillus mucosae]
MRMDHVIRFYTQGTGYNPVTGRHDNSAKLVATIYGNVTDMGVDRAVQVFGNYNHQSKILRLETAIPKSWSYLTIDDDTAKYRMQTSRKPLKGNTLIVGDSNV